MGVRCAVCGVRCAVSVVGDGRYAVGGGVRWSWWGSVELVEFGEVGRVGGARRLTLPWRRGRVAGCFLSFHKPMLSAN